MLPWVRQFPLSSVLQSRFLRCLFICLTKSKAFSLHHPPNQIPFLYFLWLCKLTSFSCWHPVGWAQPQLRSLCCSSPPWCYSVIVLVVQGCCAHLPGTSTTSLIALMARSSVSVTAAVTSTPNSPPLVLRGSCNCTNRLSPFPPVVLTIENTLGSNVSGLRFKSCFCTLTIWWGVDGRVLQKHRFIPESEQSPSHLCPSTTSRTVTSWHMISSTQNDDGTALHLHEYDRLTAASDNF